MPRVKEIPTEAGLRFRKGERARGFGRVTVSWADLTG